MRSELPESLSFITDAIQFGLSKKISTEEKDKYSCFIDKLKSLIESVDIENDSLYAINKLVKEPSSRGALLLLEEELYALPASYISQASSMAREFLLSVERLNDNQLVFTQVGTYFRNAGNIDSHSLVVGDSNSLYQIDYSDREYKEEYFLNESDIKILTEVLMDIFPNEDDLRNFVNIELNLDLNIISKNNTYRETLLDFVKWTRRAGRLGLLIKSLYGFNHLSSKLDTLKFNKVSSLE